MFLFVGISIEFYDILLHGAQRGAINDNKLVGGAALMRK